MLNIKRQKWGEMGAGGGGGRVEAGLFFEALPL